MALAALLIMASCTKEKKTLILYYSQTGITKTVAEEFQAQTGADICSFDVEQAYLGTFDETIKRCLQEMENGIVPELKALDCNLSQYDTVYLGYPVWFGTYATPVKSLLSSIKFEGKTIIPFCTFGSGGLQSSVADLRNELPEVEILDGYGVRSARLAAISDEINRFLIENGLKEGEVEALPEYSEQSDVTEDDAAIFDAACSNYQFPLGTPVSVGSRKTSAGTDYLFTAQSSTPDGKTSQSTILITVKDGAAPEFTQVIR